MQLMIIRLVTNVSYLKLNDVDITHRNAIKLIIIDSIEH